VCYLKKVCWHPFDVIKKVYLVNTSRFFKKRGNLNMVLGIIGFLLFGLGIAVTLVGATMFSNGVKGEYTYSNGPHYKVFNKTYTKSLGPQERTEWENDGLFVIGIGIVCAVIGFFMLKF
jgi:ABC-type transport system involved in multi-copper enzyme maturation permease subunit